MRVNLFNAMRVDYIWLTSFCNCVNVPHYLKYYPCLFFIKALIKEPFMDDSHRQIFSKKQKKKISYLLLAVVAYEFLLWPGMVLAESEMEPASQNGPLVFNLTANNIEPRDLTSARLSLRLPESEIKVEEVIKPVGSLSGPYIITAYNSNRAQCDNSPCITASGFNLCQHNTEDTVAVNFLPLGTKIKIPELFGDQVFVVRDRMHRRHQNRIDVWMRDYKEAKQFGVKTAKIEILP